MPTVEHIVLLKFKPQVSPEVIAELFRQLEELRELVPGINSFKAGPYASEEAMNKGFSHGFVMQFESPRARDDYLPHPEHERVKAAIVPHLEDVIAFDFES
jgi:hypothetical protein